MKIYEQAACQILNARSQPDARLPKKPLKFPNFRKEGNTSNVCIYFKGG